MSLLRCKIDGNTSNTLRHVLFCCNINSDFSWEPQRCQSLWMSHAQSGIHVKRISVTSQSSCVRFSTDRLGQMIWMRFSKHPWTHEMFTFPISKVGKWAGSHGRRRWRGTSRGGAGPATGTELKAVVDSPRYWQTRLTSASCTMHTYMIYIYICSIYICTIYICTIYIQ